MSKKIAKLKKNTKKKLKKIKNTNRNSAANDNIIFAEKRIAMSATESLSFTCGSSSLVLDGITVIQGQIVEMEGSIKAPLNEVDFSKITFFIRVVIESIKISELQIFLLIKLNVFL
ncbi:hypothetical protein [Lysinibacillus sp. NPDC056232]|uniref:hypothetical protein n=1 Tax=Lysinibacillus sp. NPDC056232 TaxID=3345756 RepID=UPI0035D9DDD8